MVLTDELLLAAADLVASRTGLTFPSHRRYALEEGLERIARRIGSVQECFDRLRRDVELFDELVSHVTVGETYFFRDPTQLSVVRETVFADLAERVRGRPIRIWSAGCASGEEAYTLAIMAIETGLAGRVQIVATDLSRAALTRAARARFGSWSLRSTPDAVRARFFAGVGKALELVPEVRQLVTFSHHNLAADPYPPLCSGIVGMDLIVCRNVLIYLDADVAARVSRQLVATLAPGGWLVLGASDPLPSEHAPCEVIVTGGGLLFRRLRDETSDSHATSVPRSEADGGSGPDLVSSPQVAAPQALEPAVQRKIARPGREGGAPESPDSWVARVRVAAACGDLEAAERTCIAALDLFPTNAELHVLFGLLLAESGRHDESARSLRVAVYLNRRLAVAHLALGVVLARTGDIAAARRSLRCAAQILSELPPEESVPLGDGEPAARLADMVRARLSLLEASP